MIQIKAAIWRWNGMFLNREKLKIVYEFGINLLIQKILKFIMVGEKLVYGLLLWVAQTWRRKWKIGKIPEFFHSRKNNNKSNATTKSLKLTCVRICLRLSGSKFTNLYIQSTFLAITKTLTDAHTHLETQQNSFL